MVAVLADNVLHTFKNALHFCGAFFCGELAEHLFCGYTMSEDVVDAPVVNNSKYLCTVGVLVAAFVFKRRASRPGDSGSEMMTITPRFSGCKKP